MLKIMKQAEPHTQRIRMLKPERNTHFVCRPTVELSICSGVHGNDSILVTRMRFTVWLRARAQMKQCSITTC
jgi:hypothetical protein